VVARNDIVWVDLGPPAGRRPVCVLTRDAAIAVLTSVTCAPITRTIRGIASEVEVGPEHGLPAHGVITTDNLIRSRSRSSTTRPSGISTKPRAPGSTERCATRSTSATERLAAQVA
jgi:mRNA interferase MazF